MKKRLLSLLLALVMVLGLCSTAFAADNPAEDAAERLYELGLFRGTGADDDGDPIFDLEKPLDRHSAVTMLVRLLGKEEEALRGEWETPFTDVASWAKPYVGYAYANGLTTGTSATTFDGTASVTTAQYLTFVLRALGYSSETDFVWSSPWALSNAIGLTNGSYSAANNNGFVRGDMAIISANALDVHVKDGAETLGEKIAVSASGAEHYLVRVLSDKELAALKDADLDTLREKISTIEDAVAFLEQFTPNGYSGFGEEIRLDIEFLFDLHTRPEATFSQTYASFAAWCITDDYDGIKYIVGVSHLADRMESDGYCAISPALALPVEDGYYIVSPGEGTESMQGNFHPIKTMAVKSLENIGKAIEFENKNMTLQQVFSADANQPDLKFAVDEDAKSAAVSVGDATLVYQISREEIAATAEKRRQEWIESSWANLQENWDRFGFPESFNPTLSKEEVEALIGKGADIVAPALKTLGDVMYYLALGGYYTTDGDIKVWDGEHCWSFNEAPWVVFADNAGNCGGTAAFVPFLLDGDYDEVGCLSMTYPIGMGGHVITYIQDGSTCYVFDSRALVDNNYTWNGGLSCGDDVVQAGRRWRDTIDPGYMLIFAYPTVEGDLPSLGIEKTVYLPEQYRNRIKIVYEAESEGYSFSWQAISEEALEQIHGIRNPMTDLPGKDVVIDSTGSYMTRLLSDEQLAALKYADAETLQAWISTVADAVAYLDQFDYHMYNSINSNFEVDVDFLLSLHRREATAPDTYTVLTGWLLADDYPETKYLAATVLNEGQSTVYHSLLLPAENGYRVVNPSQHSKRWTQVFGFDETVVKDLTEVGTKLSPYHAGMRDDSNLIIYHLVAATAREKTLSVGVDGNFFRISSVAEELYRVSDKALAEKAFANVVANWNSYGFPKIFDPTLNKAEVEALIGNDINTVASTLKTLGDVMYYLALGGYHTTDGDIKVLDGDGFWSFNDSPSKVFANEAGNCGGMAAFVPFLLTGDYDEVGCLSMSYPVEMGGGHVITYIQEGSTCYVFDSRALVDTNYTWNGGLSQGRNVVEAGRKWRNSIDPNYVLIFAYPTAEGDLPGMGIEKTVYLPEQYRDKITIVYEDVNQGYHYEWRTISEKVLEKIQQKRN